MPDGNGGGFGEGGNMKVCPYCGGICVELSHTFYAPYWAVVWCRECGAQGPLKMDDAQAIAAWNHRALPKTAADYVSGR